LIAVVEIHRSEHIFGTAIDVCSGIAFSERFLSATARTGHYTPQAVEIIAAGIPKVRDGAGGAERAGVLIREVQKPS